MNTAIHRKVCKTPEKKQKEVAVLASLASSEIRVLVPKVATTSSQTNLAVLEMFQIEGTTLTEADLSSVLMHRLGILAKAVHRFGEYWAFGSLDENLVIRKPVDSFSDFVSEQIQKWVDWHHTIHADTYIFVYAEWLRQQLDNMRPHFDQCQPLFCHGDFDLKNILVRSGEIVGLVDWEHAGVYCFEWELRKLSRFYHQRQELLVAFLEGYCEKVPNNQLALEQAICLMEATDLLGHLRWCMTNGIEAERAVTISRMHQFFQTKEVT